MICSIAQYWPLSKTLGSDFTHTIIRALAASGLPPALAITFRSASVNRLVLFI
jgi:hypothetical protein